MELTPPNIVEFSTLESKCSYLENKRSRMEYKYIENIPIDLNNALVKRGWRRFGNYYSRPQCSNCQECLNLRVDAQNFNLSKSVRRTFIKCSNIKFAIQKPTISAEHLELYDKYHKHMEQKKGWKHYSIKPQTYMELYVNGGGDFAREVLYFYGSTLIGVDLIDFIDDGISAIYFFYDPNFHKLSLGRLSMYQQILFAREQNLRWIYLGYYVKDCNSLNYKHQYKPHQILQGNPSLIEPAIWL